MKEATTIAEVSALLSGFAHVRDLSSYGERSFFVNPDGRLKRGAYFATIKEADGPNDRASRLDRPGIWRLNLGLPKALFIERFGAPPARPAKRGTIAGDWGFTALDQPTPHPIYGWMGWLSCLCPSPETLAALRAEIEAAHAKALKAAEKRVADMEPAS